MTYFSHCKDENEVRQEYRKLALEHHPDKGGDTKTMQEINAQYQAKMDSLRKFGPQQTNDEGFKYQETEEMAQEFIEKMQAILKFEGIEIEVCGSWIWLSGETKKYKDYLGRDKEVDGQTIKGAGFTWHKKKKVWFWGPKSTRRKIGTTMSMDHIRAKYGSRSYRAKQDEKKRLVSA